MKSKCDRKLSKAAEAAEYDLRRQHPTKEEMGNCYPKDDDTESVSEYRLKLNHFCKVTTAHGWGMVGKATNNSARLLWTALTVAALTTMALHVSVLTRRYLNFSSEIKLKMVVRKSDLPTVTVCNLNPMSATSKRDLLSDPNSKISSWERTLMKLEVYDVVAEKLNRSQEFADVKKRLKEPGGYYDNIDGEAKLVGQTPHDFILGCLVGSSNCLLEKNFVIYQNRDFFNCYTMTLEGINEAVFSHVVGPAAGLSLVLYLENLSDNITLDEPYHPLWNIGNSAGVRIVVHSEGTRPNPFEEGFNVPPGSSANLAVNVRSYSNLDSPYTNCINKDEMLALDTFAFNYSMSACLALCRQNYTLDKCSCLSSSLPVPSEFGNDYSYCGKWSLDGNLTDKSTQYMAEYFKRIECEAEATWKFGRMEQEELKDTCGCHPLCEQKTFVTSLSYSSWPLDNTMASFYKTYVLDRPDRDKLKAYTTLHRGVRNSSMRSALITRNFARVNVFLQSATIEEHVESPSYQLENFASDIGGTFGLWIGMSVITWCEVIQLVCALVRVRTRELVNCRLVRWMRGERSVELNVVVN